MFIHLKMPRICYAPDAGGGADSGTPSGGAPSGAPAGGGDGFTTPWSGKEGVYMIGEGEKAQPWYNGIEEEPIREYMKAKNYANPYEAARAAWNANQINKLSPEITAVLEGKATPEQENAFYAKLGRPESPDKYEFKYPDGTKVDKDLETLGRSIFHSLGASPAKAQAAMDMWEKAVAAKTAANAEADRKANDDALAELTKTWGADLDKNRAAGERTMKALGLDAKFMEKIEGLIGSAVVVELLAKIGRKSDEGGFKGGGDTPPGDPNNPDTMTPEQAAAKITQLRGDAEFNKKYETASHPEHATALALMEKLFAKAGPLANK